MEYIDLPMTTDNMKGRMSMPDRVALWPCAWYLIERSAHCGASMPEWSRTTEEDNTGQPSKSARANVTFKFTDSSV